MNSTDEKQGAKAVTNGKYNEIATEYQFNAAGIESLSFKEYKNLELSGELGKDKLYFVSQYQYGPKRKRGKQKTVDGVLIMNGKIYLEHEDKFQESTGTCDEKLPGAVMKLRRTGLSFHKILVYRGGHWDRDDERRALVEDAKMVAQWSNKEEPNKEEPNKESLKIQVLSETEFGNLLPAIINDINIKIKKELVNE